MNDDAKGDCNKQMTTVNADAASILLGGAIIAFGVGRVVSKLLGGCHVFQVWRAARARARARRPHCGKGFPGFFECMHACVACCMSCMVGREIIAYYVVTSTSAIAPFQEQEKRRVSQ